MPFMSFAPFTSFALFTHVMPSVIRLTLRTLLDCFILCPKKSFETLLQTQLIFTRFVSEIKDIFFYFR